MYCIMFRHVSRSHSHWDKMLRMSISSTKLSSGNLPMEAAQLTSNIENDISHQVERLAFFSKAQLTQEIENISDLESIVNNYETIAPQLSYDDLIASIHHLSLWPEAKRERLTLMCVPDRRERSVIRLFNVLNEETKLRMNSFRSPEDKYISFSFENLGAIFYLCELWSTIDTIKRFSSPLSISVNKIGKKASSRFRHFDKDVFVRFMKLVRLALLDEEFHSYYCKVKFLEFLPEMTLEEISHVCQVFNTHYMYGTASHPVEVAIKREIMNSLLRNIEEVDSKILATVCKFIAVTASLPILDDILLLQQMMIKSRKAESLDLYSLVDLMKLSWKLNVTTRTGVYKPLVDYVVDRLTRDPDLRKQFYLKKLETLCHVISLHRDTPQGRALLLTALDHILINEPDKLQDKEGVTLLLCLAQLGLYNHSALNLVFTSPALTSLTNDGLRKMDRKLRYSKIGGNVAKKLVGSNLLSLQGFVELECRDYTGPLITSELEETTKNCCSEDLPMSPFLEMSNNRQVAANRMFFKALQKIFGAGKVHETWINPCFGVVSYVCVLNSCGEAVDIPEAFKNQPLYLTKVIPRDDNSFTDQPNSELDSLVVDEALLPSSTWISFAQSIVHQESTIRAGGQNPLRRLLNKQGFTSVMIQSSEVVDDVRNISDEVFDKLVEREVRKELEKLKLG